MFFLINGYSFLFVTLAVFFFEIIRFLVFVCDPVGGVVFLEINGLSFLFVTLPWAFFVKKVIVQMFQRRT